MFSLPFLTDAWLETFLFVLLRFAGLIMVSPIFGRKNIPVMFKMGFCFVMTVIVMMILPVSQNPVNINIYAFYFSAIKEIALGMALGYINILIFSISVAAGQFIDMQIGFGMANFFDPQFGSQVSITGGILNIVLILVFFVVDGHHMLIQILFNSFQIVKPGYVDFNMNVVQAIIQYFSMFFVLVIKVTLPVVAVSVITEFSLGIIVKTMPQMNVFVVGVPLKIFLGIVVLILFLSGFIAVMNNAFDQMFIWQNKFVQGLVNR